MTAMTRSRGAATTWAADSGAASIASEERAQQNGKSGMIRTKRAAQEPGSMEKSYCSFFSPLAAVLLACQTAGIAREPGIPAGIQSEPSFPRRSDRIVQGVWVLFEGEPEVTTRKREDQVTAQVKGDSVTYAVTSPSGIGGATITPRKGWPGRVVLQLKLRGLESLVISSGRIELHASVLSHSGNRRLLSVKCANGRRELEQRSPYWTEIHAFDGTGKPVPGLPGKGGYFELVVPQKLLEAKPRSLTIHWIDFYR
jgi:hypothetical protein